MIAAHIKDFQALYAVLLAGMFTLITAGIAWKASLRAAVHNAKLEETSTARALWAELAGAGSRIVADVRQLRWPTLERYRPEPLDLSIFEDKPSAVGRLQPDDAFMMVQAYKLLLNLNELYRRFGNSDAIHVTPKDRHQLADAAEQVWKQIGVVLRGTYESAGLPRDKADAALTAWTSKVGEPAREKIPYEN